MTQLNVAAVDHFGAIQLAIAAVDVAMEGRVLDARGFCSPDHPSVLAATEALDSLHEAVSAWLETVTSTELDPVDCLLYSMMCTDQTKFGAYFLPIYSESHPQYQGSPLYEALNQIKVMSYADLLRPLLVRFLDEFNAGEVSNETRYMLRCVLTWWLEDRNVAIATDPKQEGPENNRKLGGVLHLIAHMVKWNMNEFIIVEILGQDNADAIASLVSERKKWVSEAIRYWSSCQNGHVHAMEALRRSSRNDNPDIAFRNYSDAEADAQDAREKLQKAIQSW